MPGMMRHEPLAPVAKGQRREGGRDSVLLASQTVRFLAIGVAGLAVVLGTFVPAVAVAESGEEMRARGEQLAKDGRYSEAIDAFKAAEKVEPRARHACFIALAYTRRELWAQAEIFLDQCHARATASDPLPEWVPMVDDLLKERLALAAPIEIRVEPADADVTLAVSSFANDELMKPRKIHLPPGRHVIIATATGFNDAQKTIEVADKSPQVVTITMLPVAVKGPDGPDIIGGGIVRTEPPSKIPTYLMAAGTGIAVAGVAVHLFLFWPASKELQAALTPQQYNTREGRFERWRAASIGLYAAGAITIGTGLVLKMTVFQGKESPVQAAVIPQDGGGILSVGWTR